MRSPGEFCQPFVSSGCSPWKTGVHKQGMSKSTIPAISRQLCFLRCWQMIFVSGRETNNNGQNMSFHDSLAAAGSKCEHSRCVLIYGAPAVSL